MNFKEIILIALVVLVIIYLYRIVVYGCDSCGTCEGLSSKPDRYARERMRNQILSNPSVFMNKNIGIDKIKNDMPWVDPVVYEDVRYLIRNKKLDTDNVDDILG
jgi:hypothetical protein